MSLSPQEEVTSPPPPPSDGAKEAAHLTSYLLDMFLRHRESLRALASSGGMTRQEREVMRRLRGELLDLDEEEMMSTQASSSSAPPCPNGNGQERLQTVRDDIC